MKKTMQFLFAMTILLEGSSSYAGTNKPIEKKPPITPPLASPVKRPLVLIVTVVDDDFELVSGATVSAPCTGQRPIRTDWTGTAIFPLNSHCNCDRTHATVTSERGSETQIELHSGIENIAIVR